MAYKLQISEILGKLKEFTGDGSVAKKVEWLRKNDTPTLRMILQHAFDPNIAYNLPEGDPPFKRNENPIDMTETSLYAETRKLSYLWLIPSNAALKNLTETQKKQFEAFEADQTAKGKVYTEAQAAYRAAEQEIEHAREHLEQAKVRLTNAINSAKQLNLQMNQAKVAADAADAKVNAALAYMDKINQELVAREGVQRPTQSNLPKYKLEMMFVQLLEALHPNEANVLLAAKNKTLPKLYPINKDIVKKAFPDILK